MKKIVLFCVCLSLTCNVNFLFAAFGTHLEETNTTPTEPVTDADAAESVAAAPAVAATDVDQEDAIETRAESEKKAQTSPFAITFYQPNYIMPLYYTGSPDDAAYGDQLPDNQTLSHYDIKFQLSLKYPLYNFNDMHKLYVAYTQMSYWQAYQGSAFFRETDYEPEVFLANEVDKPLGNDWQLNFLNVGAMHQSNGEGGDLERSWNRAYLNFIGGRNNLMVEVQPWYIFQDATMEEHNSNIGYYMGYEQVVVAYKYVNQEFSIQARNTVESGFSRSGITLGWSFPISGVRHLKGYVQAFTGYGQSLIEYNHHTNSIGAGISLSDWL